MADPLRDQLYLESRFRPVTKALTACVKADLESGLTLTEMQARYAPYGVLSYNRPLTRRRAAKFRYQFIAEGCTAVFETLPQALAYLEQWQESHQPLKARGCPTCINCQVKGNTAHCSLLGLVPWTQAWTRPDSCGQWQEGSHE